MDKLIPAMGDDHSEDDDDSFDDSDYQAALGTRPDLPEDILDELDERYDDVLSIFYACTEEDPEKRPSAKMIIDSLKPVSYTHLTLPTTPYV